MAAFDAVAANYGQLVSKNVRITGESADYFAAYKAAYIARRIVPRKGAKILDYGCGVGLLSAHLKKALIGAQIDGFDVSKDSIERVSADLLNQGTFTADFKSLGQSYDVVVISNVLHHVTLADRRGLILKSASCLAPDGKLVVFEHNPINALTRWAVSQCPFDEDAVLLSNRETRGYFHQDPLRLMWRDYVVFFPRWLKWLRPIEPVLRRFPLGAQYAVVGKRVL